MTFRWLPLLLAATVAPAATAAQPDVLYRVSALPSASASFTPLGPVLRESLPRVTPRPQAAPPNEVPLWRLLHAGRLEELQRAIRRLRQQHPSWRPSADLSAQLRSHRQVAELQAALGKGDPNALIALARRHPDQFQTRHVDRRWALAGAYYRLKNLRQAKRHLTDLLASPLSPQERSATLQRARRWLASDDYLDCLQLGIRAARDRGEAAVLEGLWSEAAFSALQTAVHAERRERIEALTRQLSPVLIARKDWQRSLSLGWLALNRHDPEAARWFERVAAWRPGDPDAAYGLALVAFERADLQEAERWARRSRLDQAGPRQLLVTLLLDRARKAYEDRRYEECLAWLEESERMTPLAAHQHVQRAWALYHREAYGEASDAFARAFELAPGDETAQGLFYSHLKAGRLEALDARSPLLAGLFRKHAAQARYYQKQFLTAMRLAREDYPSLKGLDGPTMAAAGRFWGRSGDEGTSALTGWALPAVDVAIAPGGLARMRLQVDRMQIDAGTLVGAAAVGSASGAGVGVMATLHPAYAWFEPRLHVSYADGAHYEAMVGAGPLGTTLSPLPTLSLGLRSRDAWGAFTLDAFALPVQDSVLSWLGLPDPYGGDGWGRTYRFGLAGSRRAALGGDYQVQVGGMLAHLQGERVAPNQQGRLEVSLQRDLRLPRLDFGVAGLRASYERYQRNLGHFTVGHGGYYSPQLSLGTQLTWDARTPEALPWMVSMHLGTGPAYQQLDAAPHFPLSPDGRVFQGSDQWTWGINGELKAAYMLTEQFQLGASLQFGRTPSYDQQALLLSARYSLQPRQALVSEDLP